MTLTFWNGFTASDGEILQEIVNEFNKTNDKNIKIEMDIMTWANLNEKLPTAISSKKAPDFIALNYPDFAQYVENGAVQPLDDFWDLLHCISLQIILHYYSLMHLRQQLLLLQDSSFLHLHASTFRLQVLT